MTFTVSLHIAIPIIEKMDKDVNYKIPVHLIGHIKRIEREMTNRNLPETTIVSAWCKKELRRLKNGNSDY